MNHHRGPTRRERVRQAARLARAQAPHAPSKRAETELRTIASLLHVIPVGDLKDAAGTYLRRATAATGEEADGLAWIAYVLGAVAAVLDGREDMAGRLVGVAGDYRVARRALSAPLRTRPHASHRRARPSQRVVRRESRASGDDPGGDGPPNPAEPSSPTAWSAFCRWGARS